MTRDAACEKSPDHFTTPIDTLKQAFCRRFSCPPEEFERRAFLASIYPHARCLTFLGGHRADRFVLDRSLVSYCGRLHSMTELEGELREYATHEENRHFQRRVLRLRVSGRRLKRLAATCFASR